MLTIPASAQELTGTLKHVKDTGTITLGVRESSIPFSYLSKSGQAIGYSIDLCNAVVDEVASELDGMEVTVKTKPVTSESRIPALLAGEIDLECGSTTSSFERKKQVAFSPTFFVAGTKLLVKRSSPVASYRDLAGKTVVVTAGTTNEAAVKALSDKQHLGINFLIGRDHAESFAMLTQGKADAFATDDVLLYGLIATSPQGGDYHVVGDYLSYDPYGLMFRKGDPDFAAVVERSFTKLAESRDIVDLYDKWFEKRLPFTGERLDLPMSPQLVEFLHVMGLPD
ncbi:MAG: amino acid ABC transporter substrate-binding protein [Alphaproteobacteria bacterium]|nr:amino acid ABC transporter substrate-binding protein [Alphaproteobacteria bacterium]